MADSAIEKIVKTIGSGAVQEWEVYTRSTAIPEEELEQRLPRTVEDVFVSMADYGAWGDSLITLSKDLNDLIDETPFNVVESLVLVNLYLRPMADSFGDAGRIVKTIGESYAGLPKDHGV